MTQSLLSVIQKMEIVKNRTAIEAFDYLLFNGTLAIAFNGTVGIVAEFEVDEPFSVPMTEFSKVVKACRAKEVSITVAEGKVHLKCGRLKADIVSAYTPDNEFDALVDVASTKTKTLPDGFIEGVEMCARTASNSVTMDVLNSVYVNGKEIVGSDDARVTICNIEKNAGKFIMPYASVKDVVRFSPVKMGLKDGWAVFIDGDNNQMAVRTVNDEYVQYSELFNVKLVKAKLPQKVSDLILSASIFSETNSEEEYSEVVTVKIKPDMVVVTSGNHMGSIVNSVKCSTGVKRPIEIGVHPKMFVEALALSNGVVGVGEDRIVITSDKIKHVAGLQ